MTIDSQRTAPDTAARIVPLAMTIDELARTLRRRFGKGDYHAAALIRHVIQNGNPDISEAPEFTASPKLLDALKDQVRIAPGTVTKTCPDGRLLKFITQLDDGHSIESVIIPMTRYNTLCVSSQVGCRMGCRFCETGKMGLVRNLTVEEITGQLFNARHFLKQPIKNIVFMGMGEPLDNLDAVIKAIRVFNQQKGFNVAMPHMTVSTAGLVPGIERLARLNWPQIRLAVSINAPNNEIRSRLMPLNRVHDMSALKTALETYPLTSRGLFLMEYILIRGVNDSADHARELAAYIRPLPVRLNLIALNPVRNSTLNSPSDNEMHRFKEILTQEGVFVINRWSKGRSVSAGCGQLGGKAAQL